MKYFTAIILFLLFGCTPIPERRETGGQATAKTTAAFDPTVDCEFAVEQGGKRLVPIKEGRTRIFTLSRSAFQFQVSRAECKPSVGIFTKRADYDYVAPMTAVVTTSMYAMAGSKDIADVLFTRSEDPRIPDDEKSTDAATLATFQQLCKDVGECSTQIRAFRSYWNFVDSRSGEVVTQADIKRIARTTPISAFRGEVFVMGYTEIKDAALYYGQPPFFQALQTHPMILRIQ